MKAKAIKLPEREKGEKGKYGGMGGKRNYMRVLLTNQYLDCNTVGDIFMSMNETNKWDFGKTDLANAYTIKHVLTGLYLTSNEKGELFGSIDLNSTYQKWYLYSTKTDTLYAYQNASNSLFIYADFTGNVYLDESQETTLENGVLKGEGTGFMFTFQNFPKK
ncbi:MAG: hypothetical protein MJ252_10830 [archaeon]|nr:hypothetical protein [archaeon]